MMRALIVDDREENRYLLHMVLQSYGYEVDEARHGAEALILARQNLPQLVISDLLMPVMDGYTLLRHWKIDEQLRPIPFIVYTATFTQTQDENLALSLGADAFIVKPLEPELFMQRVLDVMAQHSAGVLQQTKQPGIEDEGMLEQYSEVLISKLETKMLQLEQRNYQLQQNILARTQLEEKLREQNELLQAILESEPECVKLVAAGGKLLQMNRAGLEMLEVDSLHEMQQLKLLEFVLPEYRPAFHELLATVLAGNSGMLEFRIQGKRGTVRWLETHAAPLRDKQGKVTAMLGITRDITGRKQSEELIWHQANYDLLTGLPNRHMFRDRLEQEVKRSNRGDQPLALLLIDLDQFKEVNDTLGHDVGDILLQEAARRITTCVRKSDVVARLGGDEFTVILTDLADNGHGEDIAQKIIARLCEPYHLGAEQAYISASIGITLYPFDTDDVDQLLKNADQAMYVSKKKGRNRLSYFTPSMQESAQTRLRLLNEMRGALVGNQFRMYCQPIVNLATNDIYKAEALIRWYHPTLGLVGPADFIPLAEDSGMIVEIGDWIFCEAARLVQRLRASYHPKFQMSVNKSPIQFRDDVRLFKGWFGYLQQLQLPGDSMAIEITEGLLLDVATIVSDKLLALRDAGIQVALDDFGTGYSSLSYLKKYDIDYLKIDQTFVRNLAAGSSDLALSEAIIVMAHKLGLKVIAEGVETEAQRDFLIAAGCDYAQGFLFARPMPVAEFETWLAEKNSPPVAVKT